MFLSGNFTRNLKHYQYRLFFRNRKTFASYTFSNLGKLLLFWTDVQRTKKISLKLKKVESNGKRSELFLQSYSTEFFAERKSCVCSYMNTKIDEHWRCQKSDVNYYSPALYNSCETLSFLSKVYFNISQTKHVPSMRSMEMTLE